MQDKSILKKFFLIIQIRKSLVTKSDGLNSKDAKNMVNAMADQYLKLKKEAKEHIKATIKSEQFSKK